MLKIKMENMTAPNNAGKKLMQMANNEKTTINNAQVKVAKVVQTGNEEFGLKEKTLYYLAIITDKGKMQINVGEKTYLDVQKLTL